MINVSLVGNPNTGKTTIFNALTSSNEHVGNWHGVTVEEKAKIYQFEGEKIKLVDLPGIYSLTPLTQEEKVSTEYILREKNQILVNVCDASLLQKNLFLTLSILETDCPILLCINQIDKHRFSHIDLGKLSKILGVKIVYFSACDQENLYKLNCAIKEVYQDFVQGKKQERNLPYLKEVALREVDCVSDRTNIFYKMKILEDDEDIKKEFGIKQNFGMCEKIISLRYNFVDEILKNVEQRQNRTYGKSKLDKILLNKFLALPIFFSILLCMFYLTFFLIGNNLSNLISSFFDKMISSPVTKIFSSAFGENSWQTKFVKVGICGGINSILSFLPQVVLLFFFLTLLEESGYLTRVAFVFDDILSKVGLSGKSVYTLLMGFGCSTSAIFSARTMDEKNAQIKTAILTPYMSCSARLPVYCVLGGAFFGAKNVFVILFLYFLGVFIAILTSFILEKTILHSSKQSFILEFPPYRMISFKKAFLSIYQNTISFLKRVGASIIAMNVIVWILSNFSFSFKYTQSQGSMLETLGKFFSPIFFPLGFSSWALVSALFAGVIAKEVILSSLVLFAGVSDISSLSSVLTNGTFFAGEASVLSFLVFCLLYFPCLSSVCVLKNEIGKKWTFFAIIIEFLTAYATSFAIFHISNLFFLGKGKYVCFVGLFLIVVFIAIKIISLRAIKNCDGKCYRCHKK